jgi:hypothetical protein
MRTRKVKDAPMHFKTMVRSDVPQGRNGKHKEIISIIIRDLDQLQNGAALRVPMSELAAGKAKVRSALNRAARKAGRTVATASDGNFLYIWNVSKPPKSAVL